MKWRAARGGFLVSRGMTAARGPHSTCRMGWVPAGEESCRRPLREDDRGAAGLRSDMPHRGRDGRARVDQTGRLSKMAGRHRQHLFAAGGDHVGANGLQLCIRCARRHRSIPLPSLSLLRIGFRWAVLACPLEDSALHDTESSSSAGIWAPALCTLRIYCHGSALPPSPAGLDPPNRSLMPSPPATAGRSRSFGCPANHHEQARSFAPVWGRQRGRGDTRGGEAPTRTSRSSPASAETAEGWLRAGGIEPGRRRRWPEPRLSLPVPTIRVAPLHDLRCDLGLCAIQDELPDVRADLGFGSVKSVLPLWIRDNPGFIGSHHGRFEDVATTRGDGYSTSWSCRMLLPHR